MAKQIPVAAVCRLCNQSGQTMVMDDKVLDPSTVIGKDMKQLGYVQNVCNSCMRKYSLNNLRDQGGT